MRISSLSLRAVLAAAITLIGLSVAAPGAIAAPYPPSPPASSGPTVTVTFGDGSTGTLTVEAGAKFSLSLGGATACDWVVTFQGQTVTGHSNAGGTFTPSFTAPVVTSKTTVPVVATCNYTDSTGGAGTAIKPLDATKTTTLYVDLFPAGSLLPAAGGPAFWILLAGVAVLGSGVVIVVRQRKAHTV